MKLTKLAAGAGLALTLAAFSPAAFAQNHGNSGANYNNEQNYGNNGENSDSGAMRTERNLRRESREVSNRISSEEQNGNNVSSARRHYREGMRDWNNGNNSGARNHFEQAENDLGMNENGQNNSGNYGSGMNEGNVHQEARAIRNRINTEEQNGNDASSADHQYHLGMRDLNNGNKSGARHHFMQAENDLGMNGNQGMNGNYGAASSSGPSSGNWNNNSGHNGGNGGNGGNNGGGNNGGNQ